jgi:CubicO group peptidase (beta-lactamase class C family)
MTRLIRFVIFAGFAASFGVQAQEHELEAAGDRLLEAGAAGFAMATINADGISWSGARGFADLSGQKPMTIETIMNVASISKTVTGTSLMMLVERGKLDLDRDVNEYLPFTVRHPGHPEQPITTRQLLTHSSAIRDREAIYFSETAYYPGKDNPISLGDFVQAYLSADGRFYDQENFAEYPPGTQSQYSNVAYGLAGYLVEVISGKPLNRFSADNIFTPMGMKSTGWMLSEVDPAQHAFLYEWKEGEQVSVEWYGLATWPDGGMRTSVHDLSRFFAAMIGGGEFHGTRILQEATVKAMFQPQFVDGQVLEAVADDEGHRQGITWAYRTTGDGQTVVGHSGGDPGVTTHAYFFPDSGVGAILLVNTSSESEDFGLAVRDMIRALLKKAREESGQ